MADSTTLSVLDAKGKSTGSVDLPAAIFDVQTNVPLIHQVVTAQLAAARQGTHNTLRRGEVSGAGRKPFKQKGTGRARQGSIRAPQMTGGGIVHGPHPRDYSQRTPKKMIAAALLGALSDRARAGRIHQVALDLGGVPSTKAAAAALTQMTQAYLDVLQVRNYKPKTIAGCAKNLAMFVHWAETVGATTLADLDAELIKVHSRNLLALSVGSTR